MRTPQQALACRVVTVSLGSRSHAAGHCGSYQPTLDARIAARAAERAEAATRQAAALRRDLSDGDSDAPPSKEVTGLQRVQTQRSQRYPDQHQTELGPQQVNGTDEDSSSSSDSDVAGAPLRLCLCWCR
eukprot:COSAG01_NODE_16659_length_1217_cov_1.040250_3_plen_128_part_01